MRSREDRAIRMFPAGETVAAIAERWGVPVPSGSEPEVAVVPTTYAIRQEAAITGESIEAAAKRFGVPVPKERSEGRRSR